MAFNSITTVAARKYRTVRVKYRTKEGTFKTISVAWLTMPLRMTFLITITIRMTTRGTFVIVQATTVKPRKTIMVFREESHQFTVTVAFRIKRT